VAAEQAQPALNGRRAGRSAAIATALFGLALLLGACGGEPPDPEEALRSLVAEARVAAEARDVGALTEPLHPDFRDEDGRSVEDIERLLRGLFLRHRRVVLLTRIDTLDLIGADRAHMSVLVAMASERNPDLSVLPLGASAYRFDLDLEQFENDEWRLTAARWSRAERRDLLP
jgi:hypothetical protein